jgi:hypothetical protein
MVGAITAEEKTRGMQGAALPYPPSWVDRFTDWVRALPGSSWAFYLLAALVILLGEFLVKLADGSLTAGNVSVFPFVLVEYGVVTIAAIHYLDDKAHTALATFRPALELNDAQYKDLDYRLTTLPRRPTLVWSLTVSAAASIGGLIFHSFMSEHFHLGGSPISVLVEGPALVLYSLTIGPFIYHTFRQLWTISYIYTHYARINLFDLRPLYAFSKLTATTAVILILIVTVQVSTAPQLAGDPATAGTLIGPIILAAANFIWPLLGIHKLLAEEKDKILSEASRRMQAAINDLDTRMDTGDLTNVADNKIALEALVIKQTVLDKIPTWPWSAETLRLMGTALLLPVMLYLAQVAINLLVGK